MKAMNDTTSKSNFPVTVGGRTKIDLEEEVRIIRKKFETADEENTIMKQELKAERKAHKRVADDLETVSYTHLTLPTICSV